MSVEAYSIDLTDEEARELHENAMACFLEFVDTMPMEKAIASVFLTGYLHGAGVIPEEARFVLDKADVRSTHTKVSH